MAEMKIVWKDKKRPLFGLPISFTTYTLTESKLLINFGIFSKHEEEVRLYRMTDFSVTQTIFQRIFGVGNVNISSSDNRQRDFSLISVKKPYEVKELLSNTVEAERGAKNTGMSEFLRYYKEKDMNFHIFFFL